MTSTTCLLYNEMAFQYIRDMKVADYVVRSATVIFIWDYGGLTNHIFD